jgi:hypothetical protein
MGTSCDGLHLYWFDAVRGKLDSRNLNRKSAAALCIKRQIYVPRLAECFFLAARGNLY